MYVNNFLKTHILCLAEQSLKTAWVLWVNLSNYNLRGGRGWKKGNHHSWPYALQPQIVTKDSVLTCVWSLSSSCTANPRLVCPSMSYTEINATSISSQKIYSRAPFFINLLCWYKYVILADCSCSIQWITENQPVTISHLLHCLWSNISTSPTEQLFHISTKEK